MALGYPKNQRYPNLRHLPLPGHLILWINFAVLCFYQTLIKAQESSVFQTQMLSRTKRFQLQDIIVNHIFQ